MEPPAEFIHLHASDNVAVARAFTAAGTQVIAGPHTVVLRDDIEQGHKIAVVAISAGDKVLKYGAPIGSASRDIVPGAHVHLHNLKSDYTPTHLEGGRQEGETP